MSYASGSSDFGWNSPVHINGEVSFKLSGGGTVNTLTLQGNVDGKSTVTVANDAKTVNSAILVLKGDNSGFTGVWSITNSPRTEGSVIGYKEMPHMLWAMVKYKLVRVIGWSLTMWELPVTVLF